MAIVYNEIFITYLSGRDIALGHSYNNLDEVMNEFTLNRYKTLIILKKRE